MNISNSIAPLGGAGGGGAPLGLSTGSGGRSTPAGGAGTAAADGGDGEGAKLPL